MPTKKNAAKAKVAGPAKAPAKLKDLKPKKDAKGGASAKNWGLVVGTL
jgi:hypothetical protein